MAQYAAASMTGVCDENDQTLCSISDNLLINGIKYVHLKKVPFTKRIGPVEYTDKTK
jgi:hypothetical protein